CFSEKDPQFGGEGKIRETSIGTVLYFSSEAEIQELFSRYIDIRDLSTVEVRGRYGPHRAVCLFGYRR
ncbi:MAG TPA: class I SAM-dependent methyltransferase, partial [Methanomicrobiales archaeon]|nr:class I SAM-dependent methyltransferase [Methanomicrobiales archaeon]